MSLISRIYAAATGYVDSVSKKSAGPQPDMKPQAVLDDVENNITFNSTDFKVGIASLHSDLMGPSTVFEKDAIKIVQRGLIELGLIRIDRTKKYWWGKFSWGVYGPATTQAVKDLQALAGIKNGKNGKVFGPDTLAALRAALDAKSKGKDWKADVKDVFIEIMLREHFGE